MCMLVITTCKASARNYLMFGCSEKISYPTVMCNLDSSVDTCMTLYGPLCHYVWGKLACLYPLMMGLKHPDHQMKPVSSLSSTDAVYASLEGFLHFTIIISNPDRAGWDWLFHWQLQNAYLLECIYFSRRSQVVSGRHEPL